MSNPTYPLVCTVLSTHDGLLSIHPCLVMHLCLSIQLYLP